jgi:hypothetical protein
MNISINSNKTRWLGGPVIALIGIALSHIQLSIWSLALGGLFRGKNPDVEPIISLTAIIIPFIVTLVALISFYSIVCFRFIKEKSNVRAFGSLVVGLVVLAVFFIGIFVAAMAFS